METLLRRFEVRWTRRAKNGTSRHGGRTMFLLFFVHLHLRSCNIRAGQNHRFRTFYPHQLTLVIFYHFSFLSPNRRIIHVMPFSSCILFFVWGCRGLHKLLKHILKSSLQNCNMNGTHITSWNSAYGIIIILKIAWEVAYRASSVSTGRLSNNF